MMFEEKYYNNTLTIDDINNLNFIDFNQYSHLILIKFGNKYYNSMYEIKINEFIKQNDEQTISNNITYEILTKYKESIIEKFGESFYNNKKLIYN